MSQSGAQSSTSLPCFASPISLTARPRSLHPHHRKCPPIPKPPVPHMTLTEDPVEAGVRQELAADGIELDHLLNPSKVISLTRKLQTLTEHCASLSSDSPEYQRVQRKIVNLQQNLIREKRQVMQQWLKHLFLAQAVLFIAAGGLLSNDAIPGYRVPLVGQALGFWMTWLFSIPALRARKGTEKWEKSALNFAFVATPLLNLALPIFTKDCAAIWAADVALLFASYAYYAAPAARAALGAASSDKPEKESGRVKGILKYLDWGSWR